VAKIATGAGTSATVPFDAHPIRTERLLLRPLTEDDADDADDADGDGDGLILADELVGADGAPGPVIGDLSVFLKDRENAQIALGWTTRS